MALRVVFMGTSDFAVPTLAKLAGAATRSSPSTRSRRGRPGAALRAGPRRSRGGRAARPSGLHAADPAQGAAAEAIRRTAPTPAWLSPTGKSCRARFSMPPFRLPQSPRFASAALAGRGAHRPRDHGRRPGNRRDGHAHGSGARHRSGRDERAGRDRAGDHRRRVCTTNSHGWAPT